VEKLHNKKRILRRLWDYVYQYKWSAFAALLLSLASNLFALIGPMLSGYAIDAITPGKGLVQFDKVFKYCALMIIFYIASSLLSYILSIIMINLSQKVISRMRSDMFNKLMDLPVSYFDTHQAGEIISRMSYDIDTVNSSLSTDLLQIFTSVITVLISLAMMIFLSPNLTLIFVVTVPVSILLTRYMASRVRPFFHKRSAELGNLNGFVEEIITGLKTIKIYNREDYITQRFDKKNEDAVNAYYNADYYGSMTGPGVNFINNISLALVSVFGSILYLFGNITLGNLSSFVLYSRKFSGPINEAANIFSELQSTFAAAGRIFELMDENTEPEDLENAVVLNDIDGNVKMEHVNFGYTPDNEIIHDLNLNAEKGQLVAIVGPTGAGKSTIINLLMRFYDPESGTISIDNISIKNVTRSSLRLSYTMVLQDTWLFHGTVFQNIAYGKNDATMDEVISAAKSVRIHNFIMQLPEGYNTVLSSETMNISQGQKQLLTIARAMLSDSKILILDEATSNVDTRTEILIQQAMRKLMQDKTCFVIAHRLSTIQNADVILVLHDGEIAEQGTHEELLKANGVYSELYKAQFQ
jgi:ATP-binding cassette subfamily B protein